MTLAYLWRVRKQYPMGSRAWAKSWAKRILQAKNVALICWRNNRLQKAGAQIGNLTVITAELNGPLRNLVVGDGCAIGKASIALDAPLIIGNNVAINSNVTIPRQVTTWQIQNGRCSEKKSESMIMHGFVSVLPYFRGFTLVEGLWSERAR